jgi:hypothetical protein
VLTVNGGIDANVIKLHQLKQRLSIDGTSIQAGHQNVANVKTGDVSLIVIAPKAQFARAAGTFADQAGTTLLDAMDATTTSVSVNGGSGFPSQAPFTIQIDGEAMRVVGFSQVGVFTVERGANGTMIQPHAAGAAITLVTSSQLSARLEFLPNAPGRDIITTVNSVTGLVLNPGEISKSVTLWVKNWRSNTADRVEVLIMDGTGAGRILLPFQIPNNLPNGLDVNPGEGTVTNVISGEDPGTMHHTFTTDNQEYSFMFGFRALAGASPGITPVTLIVRQGNDRFSLRLDLVVQAKASTIPSAPPSLAANPVSGTQINLSWTAVANAAGYAVWINPGNGWQHLGNVDAGVTAYSVSNLSPGTTYNFAVSAYNSAGGQFAYTNATTPSRAVQPAAPASFTATAVSGTQVNLWWTPVANADGYAVWINSGSGWQHLGNVRPDTTAYAAYHLSPGTSYRFAVGAFNSAGTNFAYTNTTTPAAAATAPAAPDSFTASVVSATEIDLSWTGVSNADGYVVWINGGSGWQQLGNVAAGTTSYRVTNLSPGTSYRFAVGAFNGAGENFAYTNAATSSDQGGGAISAPATPNQPTWSAASGNDITLYWNDVSRETGFVVEYWNGSAWTQVSTVGAGVTSLSITNGHGFYFRVGATNSAGTSYSDYVLAN